MEIAGRVLAPEDSFHVDLKFPVFRLRVVASGNVIIINSSYNKLKNLNNLLNEKLDEFKKIQESKCREG